MCWTEFQIMLIVRCERSLWTVTMSPFKVVVILFVSINKDIYVCHNKVLSILALNKIKVASYICFCCSLNDIRVNEIGYHKTHSKLFGVVSIHLVVLLKHYNTKKLLISHWNFIPWKNILGIFWLHQWKRKEKKSLITFSSISMEICF